MVDAFREIGSELQKIDPKAAVFYSSGRASLEASYMYAVCAALRHQQPAGQLQHVPREHIGRPAGEHRSAVGTVTLDDFPTTDCILFFGHNTGGNSPRLLHDLQDCAKRGVPIIIFNPLRERGFERFTNPQSPVEMLSGTSTRISSQYHQIKVGGDKAALMGLCKAILALDSAAKEAGRERILDVEFIGEHTHGFTEFEAVARAADWSELERRSGLTRNAMEAAAAVYARAHAAMIAYGMGLTQQVSGVENVQMLVNLLLLRGNIGKRGAGILPIRGHSNVQGQRTVGITEKPDLVPLDKLRALYGFEPPREKGLNCVEACEGLLKGKVQAVFHLGGNLVRALPDHDQLEPAWKRLRLTVQIETKLNRSCLVHGEVSYILPCLGRLEVDYQASGPQAVSVEEFYCLHSRLAGHGKARERTRAVRTVDHCPIGESNVAAEPKGPVGRVGRRLRLDPGCDRADLSGHVS